MRTFKDYRRGTVAGNWFVALTSAFAFGEWQGAFAAGLWWFFAALLLGEIADRRTPMERYRDHCEYEKAMGRS